MFRIALPEDSEAWRYHLGGNMGITKANKWLRDELHVHGLTHTPKITTGMVWNIVKAMEIETPICRDCKLKQKMIFQDRGERSIYYCPNCRTEIDFEFWLNDIYAKDVFVDDSNDKATDTKGEGKVIA